MRFKKLIICLVILNFMHLYWQVPIYAQALSLPQPGTMVFPAAISHPVRMVGMTVDKNNPFKMDFIFDKGQKGSGSAEQKLEYQRLIQSFLVGLTVENTKLWVNLSPYEKNRIIADPIAQTDLGQTLLEQDYILKQISMSLTNPKTPSGKQYWQQIYAQAKAQLGTTQVQVNNFHKVWIVPDKADVYQKDSSAYVMYSHFKVMMDDDYRAIEKNQGQPGDMTSVVSPAGGQAKEALNVKASQGNNFVQTSMRQNILPIIEQQVNEGAHFAPLRQVMDAMILAAWYKKALKQSILGQKYSDQQKLQGLQDLTSKSKEAIYSQYLQAYKKGVYNFIEEQQSTPKKYFAGGIVALNPNKAMTVVTDIKQLPVGDVSLINQRWQGIKSRGLEKAIAIFDLVKDKAMTNSLEDIVKGMSGLELSLWNALKEQIDNDPSKIQGIYNEFVEQAKTNPGTFEKIAQAIDAYDKQKNAFVRYQALEKEIRALKEQAKIIKYSTQAQVNIEALKDKEDDLIPVDIDLQRLVQDHHHLQVKVFSPNRQEIFGVSILNHLMVWDARTGYLKRFKKIPAKGAIVKMIFSDDGQYLFTGDDRGFVHIIDRRDLQVLRILDLNSKSLPVLDLRYFEPGKVLTVLQGNPKQARLWSVDEVINHVQPSDEIIKNIKGKEVELKVLFEKLSEDEKNKIKERDYVPARIKALEGQIETSVGAALKEKEELVIPLNSGVSGADIKNLFLYRNGSVLHAIIKDNDGKYLEFMFNGQDWEFVKESLADQINLQDNNSFELKEIIANQIGDDKKYTSVIALNSKGDGLLFNNENNVWNRKSGAGDMQNYLTGIFKKPFDYFQYAIPDGNLFVTEFKNSVQTGARITPVFDRRIVLYTGADMHEFSSKAGKDWKALSGVMTSLGATIKSHNLDQTEPRFMGLSRRKVNTMLLDISAYKIGGQERFVSTVYDDRTGNKYIEYRLNGQVFEVISDREQVVAKILTATQGRFLGALTINGEFRVIIQKNEEGVMEYAWRNGQMVQVALEDETLARYLKAQPNVKHWQKIEMVEQFGKTFYVAYGRQEKSEGKPYVVLNFEQKEYGPINNKPLFDQIISLQKQMDAEIGKKSQTVQGARSGDQAMTSSKVSLQDPLELALYNQILSDSNNDPGKIREWISALNGNSAYDKVVNALKAEIARIEQAKTKINPAQGKNPAALRKSRAEIVPHEIKLSAVVKILKSIRNTRTKLMGKLILADPNLVQFAVDKGAKERKYVAIRSSGVFAFDHNGRKISDDTLALSLNKDLKRFHMYDIKGFFSYHRSGQMRYVLLGRSYKTLELVLLAYDENGVSIEDDPIINAVYQTLGNSRHVIFSIFVYERNGVKRIVMLALGKITVFDVEGREVKDDPLVSAMTKAHKNKAIGSIMEYEENGKKRYAGIGNVNGVVKVIGEDFQEIIDDPLIAAIQRLPSKVRTNIDHFMAVTVEGMSVFMIFGNLLDEIYIADSKGLKFMPILDYKNDQAMLSLHETLLQAFKDQVGTDVGRIKALVEELKLKNDDMFVPIIVSLEDYLKEVLGKYGTNDQQRLSKVKRMLSKARKEIQTLEALKGQKTYGTIETGPMGQLVDAIERIFMGQHIQSILLYEVDGQNRILVYSPQKAVPFDMDGNNLVDDGLAMAIRKEKGSETIQGIFAYEHKGQKRIIGLIQGLHGKSSAIAFDIHGHVIEDDPLANAMHAAGALGKVTVVENDGDRRFIVWRGYGNIYAFSQNGEFLADDRLVRAIKNATKRNAGTKLFVVQIKGKNYFITRHQDWFFFDEQGRQVKDVPLLNALKQDNPSDSTGHIWFDLFLMKEVDGVNRYYAINGRNTCVYDEDGHRLEDDRIVKKIKEQHEKRRVTVPSDFVSFERNNEQLDMLVGNAAYVMGVMDQFSLNHQRQARALQAQIQALEKEKAALDLKISSPDTDFKITSSAKLQKSTISKVYKRTGRFIAASADNRVFVSTKDQKIVFFDVVAGKENSIAIPIASGKKQEVVDVRSAVFLNEHMLAVADTLNNLIIFDLKDVAKPKVLRIWPNYFAYEMFLVPLKAKEEIVARIGKDKQIYFDFLSVESAPKQLGKRSVDLENHNLQFNHNGTYLAVESRGKIRYNDIFMGHREYSDYSAYAFRGQSFPGTFAVAKKDGFIYIFPQRLMGSGQAIYNWNVKDKTIKQIMFNAEGDRMVVVGEKQTTLWDVSKETAIRKIGHLPKVYKNKDGQIQINSYDHLSFDPAGQFIQAAVSNHPDGSYYLRYSPEDADAATIKDSAMSSSQEDPQDQLVKQLIDNLIQQADGNIDTLIQIIDGLSSNPGFEVVVQALQEEIIRIRTNAPKQITLPDVIAELTKARTELGELKANKGKVTYGPVSRLLGNVPAAQLVDVINHRISLLGRTATLFVYELDKEQRFVLIMSNGNIYVMDESGTWISDDPLEHDINIVHPSGVQGLIGYDKNGMRRYMSIGESKVAIHDEHGHGIDNDPLELAILKASKNGSIHSIFTYVSQGLRRFILFGDQYRIMAFDENGAVINDPLAKAISDNHGEGDIRPILEYEKDGQKRYMSYGIGGAVYAYDENGQYLPEDPLAKAIRGAQEASLYLIFTYELNGQKRFVSIGGDGNYHAFDEEGHLIEDDFWVIRFRASSKRIQMPSITSFDVPDGKRFIFSVKNSDGISLMTAFGQDKVVLGDDKTKIDELEKKIASLEARKVELEKPSKIEDPKLMTINRPGRFITASPDLRYFASVVEGKLMIYDAKEDKQKLLILDSEVRSAVFIDENRIATMAGHLYIWDISNLDQPRLLDNRREVVGNNISVLRKNHSTLLAVDNYLGAVQVFRMNDSLTFEPTNFHYVIDGDIKDVQLLGGKLANQLSVKVERRGGRHDLYLFDLRRFNPDDHIISLGREANIYLEGDAKTESWGNVYESDKEGNVYNLDFARRLIDSEHKVLVGNKDFLNIKRMVQHDDEHFIVLGDQTSSLWKANGDVVVKVKDLQGGADFISLDKKQQFLAGVTNLPDQNSYDLTLPKVDQDKSEGIELPGKFMSSSPNGRLFASILGGEVIVYDSVSKSAHHLEIWSKTQHKVLSNGDKWDSVFNVQFINDDVLAISARTKVQIWDIRDLDNPVSVTKNLTGVEPGLAGVEVGNKFIVAFVCATGANSRAIIFFDITNSLEMEELGHINVPFTEIQKLKISPDGTRLAGENQRAIGTNVFEYRFTNFSQKTLLSSELGDLSSIYWAKEQEKSYTVINDGSSYILKLHGQDQAMSSVQDGSQDPIVKQLIAELIKQANGNPDELRKIIDGLPSENMFAEVAKALEQEIERIEEAKAKGDVVIGNPIMVEEGQDITTRTLPGKFLDASPDLRLFASDVNGQIVIYDAIQNKKVRPNLPGNFSKASFVGNHLIAVQAEEFNIWDISDINHPKVWDEILEVAGNHISVLKNDHSTLLATDHFNTVEFYQKLNGSTFELSDFHKEVDGTIKDIQLMGGKLAVLLAVKVEKDGKDVVYLFDPRKGSENQLIHTFVDREAIVYLEGAAGAFAWQNVYTTDKEGNVYNLDLVDEELEDIKASVPKEFFLNIKKIVRHDDEHFIVLSDKKSSLWKANGDTLIKVKDLQGGAEFISLDKKQQLLAGVTNLPDQNNYDLTLPKIAQDKLEGIELPGKFMSASPNGQLFASVLDGEVFIYDAITKDTHKLTIFTKNQHNFVSHIGTREAINYIQFTGNEILAVKTQMDFQLWGLNDLNNPKLESTTSIGVENANRFVSEQDVEDSRFVFENAADGKSYVLKLQGQDQAMSTLSFDEAVAQLPALEKSLWEGILEEISQGRTNIASLIKQFTGLNQQHKGMYDALLKVLQAYANLPKKEEQALINVVKSKVPKKLVPKLIPLLEFNPFLDGTLKAVSPDLRMRVVGRDHKAVIMDDHGGREKTIKVLSKQRQPGWSSNIRSAALTEDKKFMVTSSDDNKINFWDISKLEAIKNRYSFESDATTLDLYGDKDHTILVLNEQGAGQIGLWFLGRALEHYERLSSIKYKALSADIERVDEVKFSPDGRWLAVAVVKKENGGSKQDRRSVVFLDVSEKRNPKVVHEFIGYGVFDFDPNSTFMAINAPDKEVHVIDIKDKHLKTTLVWPIQHEHIRSLSYHPDGRYLAAGGMNYIEIWDMQGANGPEVVQSWEEKGEMVYCDFSGYFSKDGKMFQVIKTVLGMTPEGRNDYLHMFWFAKYLQDAAQTAQLPQSPGGIDLNPELMQMSIRQMQDQGQGIFDLSRFGHVKINGLVPSIIEVVPVQLKDLIPEKLY